MGAATRCCRDVDDAGVAETLRGCDVVDAGVAETLRCCARRHGGHGGKKQWPLLRRSGKQIDGSLPWPVEKLGFVKTRICKTRIFKTRSHRGLRVGRGYRIERASPSTIEMQKKINASRFGAECDSNPACIQMTHAHHSDELIFFWRKLIVCCFGFDASQCCNLSVASAC